MRSINIKWMLDQLYNLYCKQSRNIDHIKTIHLDNKLLNRFKKQFKEITKIQIRKCDIINYRRGFPYLYLFLFKDTFASLTI